MIDDLQKCLISLASTFEKPPGTYFGLFSNGTVVQLSNKPTAAFNFDYAMPLLGEDAVQIKKGCLDNFEKIAFETHPAHHHILHQAYQTLIDGGFPNQDTPSRPFPLQTGTGVVIVGNGDILNIIIPGMFTDEQSAIDCFHEAGISMRKMDYMFPDLIALIDDQCHFLFKAKSD